MGKGNGIIKMKWYWEHVGEHIVNFENMLGEHIENFGNRLVGGTHWVHTLHGASSQLLQEWCFLFCLVVVFFAIFSLG